MACRIADNKPLAKLSRELGISPRCHGKRRECIQGFQTHDGAFVMGAAGAAIGYCQALFANTGNARQHTEKLQRLLREIEAPWCESHELQWGYRLNASAGDFVSNACAPLLGSGRVPILITALDPARHADELRTILASAPALPDSESILVRVILNSTDSVTAITEILRKLVADARTQGRMPKWWPLLQGTISRPQWSALKASLGTDWNYVNVAVNPFVADDVYAEVESQITVAQIPVARSEGIHSDGEVQLHPSVRILGAAGDATYSMAKFAEKLARLPVAPTVIVLGPSQQDWSDEENQERTAAILPLVRQMCDQLWSELTPQRREQVWKLAA
jgi:hypothetical protein